MLIFSYYYFIILGDVIMTGRNNHNNQYAKRVPHYGLRQLSIGVASVLLSTSFYLGASQLVVKADTNSAQVTNSQSGENR